MARSSAEALLAVIDDILDFSKMEANRLELDSVDFNLNDCLEEALKSFAPRAGEKGIELTCEVRPGVPAVVHADPARLRQIITNLVGNALKFTERGEVCLRVANEGEPGGPVRLHFTVSDTGIGIPAEKQKLIFQAFAQRDTSISRRYGGTGLGLTISARLVKLMGGEIWVRSDSGQGSEFHFTIAVLPAADETPPQPASIESLHGILVLVVDDNATNRRILAETLGRWGMRVTLAPEGTSALENLESGARAGVPFRLMLIDANMPELDGFAVARLVKLRPEKERPATIMLTSCGHIGDVALCREAGVSAYLTKPVRHAELRAAVCRALQIFSPAAPLGLPAKRGDSHSGSLQILVAEDNLINQHLAVRLLEKRGHRVTVATNGQQAVDLLDQRAFDVVLMDVQMPEVDGFEATAIIRAREMLTGRHVPIIAMTANAMQGDQERCLQAGMDGYLAKPIKAGVVFSTIESVYAAVSQKGLALPFTRK